MVVPLSELYIENFRAVRQTTVQLDPRITVLFGSNAAGKTTILDALAIGLGALTARLPRPSQKKRAFASRGDLRFGAGQVKLFGGSRPSPTIEAPFARIALVSCDGLHWDVTEFRSPLDKASVPAGRGTKALDAWMAPRVVEALDAPPDRPTSPIPLVAAYGNQRAVIDVPLRDRDFNQEFGRLDAFDGSLKATTRFKTVFEWLRVMEDQERREREKRHDFDYRLPELEWIRRAIALAELRCHDPRVETRPLRMLVDFEHEDGRIQPLDISALSDGYRTHFALVVDLARRMVQLNPSEDLDDPQRGTRSPAVVLIDEVDLHLDPRWQGRVVQGLLSAFPNTQFVVTTHSEQVLGSVEAHQVRHLRWSEDAIVVEEVRFAQGATGERILIELMDAPERVPGRYTTMLRRYLALVDDDLGRSEAALELRRDLEQALGNDPALHRADLEMQRRELVAQLHAERG